MAEIFTEGASFEGPYLLNFCFVANETKAPSFRIYDRFSTFKRTDKPSFSLKLCLVRSFLYFCKLSIVVGMMSLVATVAASFLREIHGCFLPQTIEEVEQLEAERKFTFPGSKIEVFSRKPSTLPLHGLTTR